MNIRVELPSKALLAVQTYKFDFTSLLAVGETISTQVCTATVYSGTDASPSSIISGAASSSGAVVSQLITGGTLGVLYELRCVITTSAGQTLVLAGYLAIIPDLV